MKPTVGRIVHYIGTINGKDPSLHAAIVTRVEPTLCLVVFTEAGSMFFQSVLEAKELSLKNIGRWIWPAKVPEESQPAPKSGLLLVN